MPLTKEEAMNLFGLNEGFTKEELDSKYNDFFKQKRQNVIDPRNLGKPYNESGGQDLRKISEAYAVLLKEMD